MKAYKTNQGNWQLNFTIDNVQKTLYIGKKCNAVQAGTIANVVTEIVNNRITGDSLSTETLRKLQSFDKRIQKSLCRLGLVENTIEVSFQELYNRFEKTIQHLKPDTISKYRVWNDRMKNYFGTEISITRITEGDVKNFSKKCTETLSETTVCRGLRCCRTIFDFAIESGIICKNPFKNIPRGTETNEARQFYVSRELIEKILKHCLSDRERLAVALARFGGLRVPSEIRELRFCDFTETVIRIHDDTKTGKREVPLFKEVKEIFERLHGNPEELVFGTKTWYWGLLARAIKRSGIPLWEKLWINLRSSCITDLDELGYSEKTLDAIFGNSAKIRKKHYIQLQKEREYRKILEDNSAIVDFLRKNGGVPKFVEKDFSLQQILTLRNFLVTQFGTEKIDTLLFR